MFGVFVDVYKVVLQMLPELRNYNLTRHYRT